MFSRIFIERPKLAMVISIVTVFAGVLCYLRMPVAEYPEIAPPQVWVTASYPGAGAEVIADTIAAPIESKMNGLEEMLYYQSSSNNDGSYSLTITFEPNSDTDMAQVNVQNAIKRAESQLPAETRALGIDVKKRSSDMLGMFIFTIDREKNKMPLLALSNYLRANVQDEMSRINGISQAEIMGTSTYSMRVWLDPLKMSSLGVTPDEVAAAIQTQNIQAAAGSVGAESSNPYIQFKVNAFGRLKDKDEFEDITIRVTRDGRMLKVRDVARVELGAEDYSWSSRGDGMEVVTLALYRNEDANALDVINKAKSTLADLKKRFPEGVDYHMGYDPTEYINASMQEIKTTLLLTLVLVVAITYIFLQNWRATLIPALTIPVSIMGTFIFLYPLGFSLNLLTMFALILVIGSLVDDAIVVVENVIRIMEEEKLSAKEATIKSMGQITGAIIATTLVIVAIYAPIGFYGGMVGTIYLQFSVTMCIALCFSTLNALTLSPALCSVILKHVEPPKSVLNPFTWFNVVLNWTRNVYLFFTKLLVKVPLLTIILFALVIFGCEYFFTRIHPSFLPEEDKGALLVGITLPPSATLPRTNESMQEFFNRIKDVEGMREVITVAGFSFIGGKGENLGLAIAALKDWEFRTSPETEIHKIKEKVQALTSTMPEANVLVFQPPAIMGLGATGGVSAMLLAKDEQTPAELENATNMLVYELNKRKDIVFRAYSSYNANTPQLFLDIDRDKAEALGIPVSRVFSTLQSKLASYYVNDFNLGGYTYKVKLQAEAIDRSDMSDIEQILVASDNGKMIPLSAFSKLEYMVGPRVVTRFNQSMAADIKADALPGVSSGQMMNLIQEIVDTNPALKGYEIAWVEMSYQEKGNEGKIGMLMGLALIFAYLFLVGQYESWTMPLSVILSVAIAACGALAGLYILGMPLSIYAQLGLIMLIGLAGKNAILMAEFSKQARETGESIVDSAQNGGKVRYRAVLMTAWSFVIGVFPMVIATGAGAGSRQAIGHTTFWGMVAASIIGIVFVPPLWAIFQRVSETSRKIRQKIFGL